MAKSDTDVVVPKSNMECRVCINNNGSLPIFGDGNRPDISMEIALIGGVQLHETDDLPKFICEQCFRLLEGAIVFRLTAKKSDSLLKRRNKKKGLTSNTNHNYVKREQDRNKPAKIDFVSVKEDDCDDDVYLKTETEFTEETAVEELVEEALFDEDIELLDDNSDNNDTTENDNEMVMVIVSDHQKKTKTKKIHCRVCKLCFESMDGYEEHRKSVEHKRNYVISFLPKKQKTGPDEEKKTKHPKDHKCEICNRMFTKLHYPRHMQTQHKVAMITSRSSMRKECPVCKKMFHPVALNRHMKRAHVDEKDLPPKVKVECPVCKKLFSKDFYPLHMQRHKEGDKKNYICDQCGQEFFFKSTFYTHRLIHSNDLPHKCDYCPYRGRTKGLLKTHVRTHTGDYPYKCTQCDTRCLTKSNLNAHMQRHRGPVDFICDTCTRGFYSKLYLERHISVVHLGIKNHICNICGMAFGYRHGLMSHQINVHKRAKGKGKPKAVYLKLEEEGLLQHQEENQT